MNRMPSKFRLFQITLGISIIIADVAIQHLMSISPFVSAPSYGVSGLSILGLIFIFAGLFYKGKGKKQKPSEQETSNLYFLHLITGSITALVAIFITWLALPWFESSFTYFNPFFWSILLFPWVIAIVLLYSAFTKKPSKKHPPLRKK